MQIYKHANNFLRGRKRKYHFTQKDLFAVSNGVISCQLKGLVGSPSETSGICCYQICVKPTLKKKTSRREA